MNWNTAAIIAAGTSVWAVSRSSIPPLYLSTVLQQHTVVSCSGITCICISHKSQNQAVTCNALGLIATTRLVQYLQPFLVNGGTYPVAACVSIYVNNLLLIVYLKFA